MSTCSSSKPIKDSLPAEYQSAAARSQFPRDTALDFTKGTLVLFMVLYHWLNYFISSQGKYYDYLRFLTPSFIFITGFMISQIHIQRFGASGWHLPKRLAIRGLKLLAVFIGLNSLIDAIVGDFRSWRSPAATLVSIFISGNITASVGHHLVAFSILVPIAYLLILSSVLIILARRIKHIYLYTLMVFVVVIMFLSSRGISNTYLDVLMAGLLGVVVGFAGREQIEAVVRHPYVLVALYCLFLATITIWQVTLPLQTVSVLLTTALIYIVGNVRAIPGVFRRPTILLGKYSLVGYISQIAILRGLRGLSWRSWSECSVLIVSLSLGFLLTLITVELTDFARRRSRLADKLYQVVFA